MSNNISESIQNAANIEATPALVDFWSKQFQGFAGQKFTYDSSTGIGSIDLMQHLTSDKKDIDHQLLQQTIAVLIRFLDALTPELEYRNIKLSVLNFDQFLKSTDTPPQIGADYIGGLIADFSYRASENLAHEKGAFPKLKDMPKHIRAIEYEMWTDVNGEYKNGQELATMFDDQSIIDSHWSLVPRRNFAILDFPTELNFWDKWRDSYSNAQYKIEAMTSSVDINSPTQASENMLNEIGEELNEEASFDFDSEFSVPVNHVSPPTKVVDFPDLNEIKANLAQVNSPEIQNMEAVELPEPPMVPEFEESNHQAQDLYSEESTLKDSQNQPDRAIETEKQELYSELNHGEASQNQIQTDQDIFKTDMELASIEPVTEEIVLGELVKIIDVTSPLLGKVFQVIDITDGEIRLSGQDELLQNHIFNSNQLQKQNLYEILEHINEADLKQLQNLVADYPVSMAAALILNEQNQVLLVREKSENNESKLTLPSTSIKHNQIPEEAILKYLQQNLSSSESNQTRIIDEVGSVMVAKNENDTTGQNSIYNIFYITTNQSIDTFKIEFDDPNIISFEFVSMGDIPKELMLVKIALDKHNRKQNMISEAVSYKIQEYQKEQVVNQEEKLIEIRSEIRADLESKIKTTLEPEIRAQILAEKSAMIPKDSFVPLDLNLPEYALDSNEQVQMVINTNPDVQVVSIPVVSSQPIIVHKAPSLAKFKVKLEHWIESDKFGNMALSLGYSPKGIESVSLSESSLASDVKSTINLILHLFNHLLDNGLDLQQLLGGLNLQYGDNEVPINQILSLILSAITSAPQKISHMSDEWLV